MTPLTLSRASSLLLLRTSAAAVEVVPARPGSRQAMAAAAAASFQRPMAVVAATMTTSQSSGAANSALPFGRRQRRGALARDGWVRGRDARLFGGAAAQAKTAGRSSVAAPRAAAAAVQLGGLSITRDEVVRGDDPTNNVPDSVFAKLGSQLHNRENHPLGILKNEIYRFFDERFQGVFKKFDDLSPIVSVKANFDDVLVPEDHVSRRYNDTYYISSDTLLRCHTSAHQAEKLREGHTHFLVTGDVYRRDAIDATHYPVFHQMEGFRVIRQSEWEAANTDGVSFAANELKQTLEGLAEHLFGKVDMRWVDTYFPFTDPSFELEIYYQGKWMEVLGSGVVEQEILDKNGCRGTKAWAFGLGLERLAMVLFEVPDIRLFWSGDRRFTSQFKAGQLRNKFKPFSKFPPCLKDISFWISDLFSENNFCELVRGVAGDLVEEVRLIDEFTNPKKRKTSHCYRVTYRSMERSLTDDEINDYQAKVREEVESKLKVSLR